MVISFEGDLESMLGMSVVSSSLCSFVADGAVVLGVSPGGGSGEVGSSRSGVPLDAESPGDDGALVEVVGDVPGGSRSGLYLQP